MDDIREIPIEAVNVAESRLVKPTKRQIRELEESISQIGLQQPIIVTQSGILVAGLRRLRACQRLGWENIPAVITEQKDPNMLRLMEIDENLKRGHLTALDQAIHRKARKEIYEQLYPDTVKGVRKTTRSSGAKTFTEETAETEGVTPRAVQMEVKIGERLEPYADRLNESPVAKRKFDLIELSNLADTRLLEEVIDVIVSEKSKTLAEAKNHLQEKVNKLAYPDRIRYEPLLGAQRPTPVEATKLAREKNYPVVAEDGHAYSGSSGEMLIGSAIAAVRHVASDAFVPSALAPEDEDLSDETIQTAIERLDGVLSLRKELYQEEEAS